MLRLRLPAEVKVSESKCQRAKVNGALLIIMPKLDPKANAISVRGDQRAAQRAATATATGSLSASAAGSAGPSRTISSQQRVAAGAASSSTAQPQRTVLKPKKLSLQEQMMQEALQSAASATSTTASSEARDKSLLDASIGPASRAGVNVSNIVPRKEERANSQPTAADETVFQMSSRVVELD